MPSASTSQPQRPDGAPPAAGGMNPEQAADDIFLTPRVIDRGAFDDYAASLRRLIADAGGETQTLSRTAADVRLLRDQLASATQDAQRRLETLIRAAAMAEAKPGARAEGSASAARQAASAGEARAEARPDQRLEGALAARIDAMIETRVGAAIAGQAAEAERGLLARVGPLIERLERGLAEPGSGSVRDESIARSMVEADERLARFERSLESAAHRFASETNEQVSRVSAAAREAIEHARQECEAAVRQITTGASLRVRRAQQDADAVMEALERELPGRLGSVRERFDATMRDLTAEASERVEWIRAALSQVEGPGVEALRTITRSAAALTDGGAEGSLAWLVARAEAARATIAEAIEQVGELGRQVGLMRDLLGRSILDGVARIDALDARQEELLTATARAVEQYAHEIESLRTGMAAPQRLAPGAGDGSGVCSGADEALVEITQRLDDLRTHTDHAAQTAEWLGGLIDRAARIGIALDEAPGTSASRASSEASARPAAEAGPGPATTVRAGTTPARDEALLDGTGREAVMPGAGSSGSLSEGPGSRLDAGPGAGPETEGGTGRNGRRSTRARRKS